MTAHHREDDILQRVFVDIAEGFYVDVGAYAPVIASNTYALYQKGWHGIIIEPFLALAPDLVVQWQNNRSRDDLIPAMAAESFGTRPFYVADHKEMSTGAIDRWRDMENVAIGEPTAYVTCDSLTNLFDEHVKPGTAIHLLSLDVEGMEDVVITGLDLTRWRPWVMVIEASMNEIGRRNTLEQHNYKHVLHDGYNEWYIAIEHDDLSDLIK